MRRLVTVLTGKGADPRPCRLVTSYLALEHRGDTRTAARARADAARYWRDADPELPELTIARGAAAGSGR
jgi:hypothetical protein